MTCHGRLSSCKIRSNAISEKEFEKTTEECDDNNKTNKEGDRRCAPHPCSALDRSSAHNHGRLCAAIDLVAAATLCGDLAGTRDQGGLQRALRRHCQRRAAVFRLCPGGNDQSRLQRRHCGRAFRRLQRRHPDLSRDPRHHRRADEPLWRLGSVWSLGADADQKPHRGAAGDDRPWRDHFYRRLFQLSHRRRGDASRR